MHRHVEGRQPVFLDPVDVPLLQVGEGREVAIAEREAIVVVADVEDLPEPVRVSFHEAEVAPVGAAADPHRLHLDPHRKFLGTFDVVLDLFAIRVPDVQQERLVSGEELPVDEILDLPPADGEDLRAGAKAEFGPEGVGMD